MFSGSSMPLLNIFRQSSSTARLTQRTICVANKCPPDVEVTFAYPNNKVITSKYTVWNFLFKNLFEQFQRIANFYFLCIAITQFSIKSPVNPATSLLPLIFVVSVTAVKQAYEDWIRHKSDNIVNTKPAVVLQNGILVPVKSQDIKVGDIVMVKNEQESPCDLVLLSSSNADGHCHITTANLDGETNLKDQMCSEQTVHYDSPDKLNTLCAIICCESPSPDLYKFNGKITIYSESNEKITYALDAKNLFLKGATLKNTDFVFGCAVYTGQDTKLVLNLKFSSNKFSTVEKSLNQFLLIFLVALLFMATTGTVLLFIFDYGPHSGKKWYIPSESRVSVHDVISDFLAFLILFNYIIPISLYVTLDLIKFIGAQFFTWDIDLYDEASDQPAICNSSDLNEELGQVEFLFSDKTGTLTENKMVFRQCSVNGFSFEERNGKLCLVGSGSVDMAEVEHFLTILALCNTVQIHKKSERENAIEYFAISPDEKALVEACARFGVVLTDISGSACTVQSRSGTKVYRKLCVLEFDSDRKRMSIIVEHNGSMFLFCKGADNAILSRISSGKQTHIKEHICEYALAGFRTLVIAEKKMAKEEYTRFNNELQLTRCLLQNREEMVCALYDKVEQNLHLCGATAVEDQLQENVCDTIESLRHAGIKVWILTGDHPDTALNVSYACGHIKRDMIKLCIFQQQDSGECHYTLKHLLCRITEDPTSSYFLVIDGSSIAFAIHDHADLFRNVAEHCIAVLCCRLSPLQKSQVVKLIKSSPCKPITAAIGDGANDVSMIQEAHVGIGIIGNEGRHAARCSDFAFSKFYFLKKALLIHGQYYYIRASTVVQYFFYKNVAFVFPQFLYVFFNGFTPQPLYNGVFLMLYNICFTSLPIFLYGFTEKNSTQDKLLNNPVMYRKITKNSYLTWGQFAKWTVAGLWHGLIIFYVIYVLWADSPCMSNTGWTLDSTSFGIVIISVVIVIANLKLALHTKYWTLMLFIAFGISFMGFLVFTLLYNAVYWSVSTSTLYGVFFVVLQAFQIWLAFIIIVVIALLPDVVLLCLEQQYLLLLAVIRNVGWYD